MSQSTLSDDELFGEAASEIRDDVESSLEAARAELPEADEVWETDADNALGVLNGLKSALDVGDAAERVRDAKKWFVIGERADAFEDASDLEDDIEELEDVIEEIEGAREEVSDLASTVPELRSSLEAFAGEAESEGEADEEDEENEEE